MPIANPVECQGHDGARAFAGDDLEMIGLAANDYAQRHEPVIGPALLRSSDRCRNLQRARHRQDAHVMARLSEFGARPFEKLVVERVVIARFHRQYMRHTQSLSGKGRSLTTWMP